MEWELRSETNKQKLVDGGRMGGSAHLKIYNFEMNKTQINEKDNKRKNENETARNNDKKSKQNYMWSWSCEEGSDRETARTTAKYETAAASDRKVFNELNGEMMGIRKHQHPADMDNSE